MHAAISRALILAILSSSACYTTKRVSIDEGLGSPRVSLTLRDQSVVVVYGPKIYGNKLVGYVRGKYEEYPTAELTEARVRVLSGARTAALVATGVVAFGGFVYVLLGKGTYSLPSDYCAEPDHADDPQCEGQH